LACLLKHIRVEIEESFAYHLQCDPFPDKGPFSFLDAAICSGMPEFFHMLDLPCDTIDPLLETIDLLLETIDPLCDPPSAL
jgi:hypothetical protein